jgi:catechol 2,3-dioxygenase-like lactoylglutathione lyase family enzyme
MGIPTNLPTRLHHTAYVTRDMEKTRHFYEDLIGLPLVATRPTSFSAESESIATVSLASPTRAPWRSFSSRTRKTRTCSGRRCRLRRFTTSP